MPGHVDPPSLYDQPLDIQEDNSVLLDNETRPLQNAPFCPIAVSGSNFNPRNTQCIAEVKIFAFLALEQN
jgi:hypothetical protein